jgi:hypothetical protein
MKSVGRLWVLAAVALVGACGGEPAAPLPTQRWLDNEVRVETRPSPPQPGTAEILVIISDRRGQPVYDLIVSLRTADRDPWVQSIQDGHVGVYRRAARLDAGERSVLQVQIQRGETRDVLRFPLGIKGSG